MKKKEAFPEFYKTHQERLEQALRYYQHPIAVSLEFRGVVIQTYPQLETAPNSVFYWRLLQHILFSTYTDKFDETRIDPDNASLVLTHEMVADMTDRKPYDSRFRSGKWIADFSAAMFDLGATDWNKTQHRARAIKPSIDKELLALAQHELSRHSEKRVWFHNGKIANAASIREENKRRAEELQNRSTGLSKDHPARELLDYLNSQPQVINAKILRRNWPLVERAVLKLTKNGSFNTAQAEWCRRSLNLIEDFWDIVYISVDGSPRIYVSDMTVIGLPRELRKIAFAGTVEMDLRACQLAIVASKWKIPSLKVSLEANLSEHNRSGAKGQVAKDIWHELLAWIDSTDDAERYKPILKDSIYSIVFGMSRKNVETQLAEGSYHYVKHKHIQGQLRRTKGKKKNEGIGKVLAEKLMQHPHFKALFAARNKQTALLKKEGGMLDAFGTMQSIGKGKDALSVLAYVVQSYELRLMLPLFEIARRNKQIYILSWLHDGATIDFGNTTKMRLQIEQIKKAVAAAAREGGIPTELEVSLLDAPDYTDDEAIEQWLNEKCGSPE